MNEVTVLHLSDLHINTPNSRVADVLKDLVVDIKDQLKYSTQVILVVTGDVIHMAGYENKDAVLEFFKLLYTAIGNKIVDLYIVPGNHDKKRSSIDKEIVESCETRKVLNIDYYNECWKYHLLSFQLYLELVKEIYSIFQKEYEFVSDTFGVKMTKVEDKNICFVSLNSAWACYREEEQRKVRIGEFQLQKVKESLLSLKDQLEKSNEKIDLTILLSHHPLEWLYDYEEDTARAYILGNQSLNVDVMLCGHTHNIESDSFQNNNHLLSTLKTGIGWPDKTEEKDNPRHSYSIYVFNLDINSIDIYMRSSKDGNFDFDYTTYGNKKENKISKLIYPLRRKKNQPYIEISSGYERSAKGCILTENLISEIKRVSRVMEEFRACMMHSCDCYKEMILQQLCLDENSCLEEESVFFEEIEQFFFSHEMDEVEGLNQETKKKLLSRFSDEIYDSFTDYLLRICLFLGKSLFGGVIKEGERVRIHFRYYHNKKYEKLMAYDILGEDEGEKPLVADLNSMGWEDLLKNAYMAERPLIYAANKALVTEHKLRDCWNNFITIIPFLNDGKNDLTEKLGNSRKSKKAKRPALTFGISVSTEAYDELLYVLDYLDIHQIIGDVIEDFLYYFGIELSDYLKSFRGQEMEEVS